jgi:hypothetical protein
MRKAFNVLSVMLFSSLVSVTSFAASFDVGRLQQHLSWCMRTHSERPGQQGITTYVSGTDQYRSVIQLRRDFGACQAKNNEALNLIYAATDYQFLTALAAAVDGIEQYVAKHMRWVAYERLRAADLLSAYQIGDVATIRAIYTKEQSANPEARANLKGVSDMFLLNLVATL